MKRTRVYFKQKTQRPFNLDIFYRKTTTLVNFMEKYKVNFAYEISYINSTRSYLRHFTTA